MRQHGFLCGMLVGMVGIVLYVFTAASFGGNLPMPDAFFNEAIPLHMKETSRIVTSRKIAVITTAYGTALLDVMTDNDDGITYRWRYKPHLFGREISGQGQAVEPANDLARLKVGPIQLTWSSGLYLYLTPDIHLTRISKNEFEKFIF